MTIQHDPPSSVLQSGRPTSKWRRHHAIRNAVFAFGALACSTVGLGQQPTSDTYLGQTPPGEEAKLFLSGITDRIAVSRDAREFYFKGPKGLQWVTYADGKWTNPRNLFARCSAPALSADEKTLYFQDSDGRILQSTRTGDSWSDPKVVIEGMTGLHYFQVTNSGHCYATAMGKSAIEGQISHLKKTEGKCVIVSLGPPINSADNGVDFFMARDESYIIFVEHPGGKDGDLVISFHQSDGTWSKPKNLGPTVNTAATWEWGPFVTVDNKYLFYTSGSNAGNAAVYWVKIDGVIERLKNSASSP